MGAICLERLPGDLGRIAIETGTCRGFGAASLAKRFERVFTIELSEELHARAREKLAAFPHVECLRGSSAALLPEVLARFDEPVFLFLDAHWSGDRTVNWAASKWKGYGHDTAHLGAPGVRPSGPEQCPLAEELTAIMEHCRGPATVLIDDAQHVGLRDNGFPGEDWTHLSREKLRTIVAPRLLEWRELERPAQWLLVLSPRVAAGR